MCFLSKNVFNYTSSILRNELPVSFRDVRILNKKDVGKFRTFVKLSEPKRSINKRLHIFLIIIRNMILIVPIAMVY